MKAYAVRTTMLLIAAFSIAAVSLQAAPSLLITEPPVYSTLLDGPSFDPASTNGQWFMDLDTGGAKYRTHEFYDNVIGHGGGSEESSAIVGMVISVRTNAIGEISDFNIDATIFNDTLTVEGWWSDSENSHEEYREAEDTHYVGTLIDTKLTAEFAIADTSLLPNLFSGPYSDPFPRGSYIIAKNEDQLAWYCWNELATQVLDDPGDFYLPTWDFGHIHPGQSTNRLLKFSIDPPMDTSDPRYAVIMDSYELGDDILANRTTSLKVSTWIEWLGLDDGIAYLDTMEHSSDVSVFHNIEEEPQEGLDFGDLPDNYNTTLASNGANHSIVSGVHMGVSIDDEPDGQPLFQALGDDLDTLYPSGGDDEDGVQFYPPMILGQNEQIDVTVSAAGWLDVWIDADNSGNWTGPDLIWSGSVSNGLNPLSIPLPIMQSGLNYMRFRYNTGGPLPPTGWAEDGEVEDYAVVIEETEEVDWGDAPDLPYPTLAISNGANHVILPGAPILGFSIDPEPDGQPDPNALGDDTDGNNDEDGIILTSPPVPGAVVTVDVIASAGGSLLQGWIDFNADGDWRDTGEQIFTDHPLAAGVNGLSFLVPTSTPLGSTFARFRLSSSSGLTETGSAPDGEVEDYEIFIEDLPQDNLDWGDVWIGYEPAIIPWRASHIIVSNAPILGNTIDSEPIPLNDNAALGDDFAGLIPDDEDGIIFTSPFVPGQLATIDVIASGAGSYLQGWIDIHANADWADPGEHVIVDYPLAAGVNSIAFTFPSNAGVWLASFARFRICSVPGISPYGMAPDGEVEDYWIFLATGEAEEYDWGDAPDPTYPTLATNSGAFHLVAPNSPEHTYLGTKIDVESDGQPTVTADGDDTAFTDDEDGVRFLSPLVIGESCLVSVVAHVTNVSIGSRLDAWIDFNIDGDWFDPGEQIFTSEPLVDGTNLLSFTLPDRLVTDASYARFRLSYTGGLAPYGMALGGEVEDYRIHFVEELDWGDAPDSPYPTLDAYNGAYHGIVPGLYLGSSIDSESDGQPNATASGDDNDGNDDEDGVQFSPTMIRGSSVPVTVVLNSGSDCKLNAWVDFNGSGVWGDQLSEFIFVNANLTSGVNTLYFPVPADAVLGTNYARFRMNTAGGLSPFGAALDGEVEDYMVILYQPAPSPDLVITNLYFTESNTVTTVEWNSQSGITYQMQSTTNLMISNSWMNVGGYVFGPINWQTNSTAPRNQFYRITAPWTP